MTIRKEQEGGRLTISLGGRLDTTTAPLLEVELRKSLDDVQDLEFDFGGLEYISSAGLRVLLTAQKRMNRQGRMVICNANQIVREFFEVAGFVDILTIE